MRYAVVPWKVCLPTCGVGVCFGVLGCLGCAGVLVCEWCVPAWRVLSTNPSREPAQGGAMHA